MTAAWMAEHDPVGFRNCVDAGRIHALPPDDLLDAADQRRKARRENGERRPFRRGDRVVRIGRSDIIGTVEQNEYRGDLRIVQDDGSYWGSAPEHWRLIDG